MTIHQEGRVIIIAASLICLAVVFIVLPKIESVISALIMTLILLLYGFLIWFFRNPTRKIPKSDDTMIYAPADGKVVAIEEIHEEEYFDDDRIQISIFMSPLNVHVNRIPVSGVIRYYKYHAGRYLVAWHPKSSKENEHTTFVLDARRGPIMLRQIAGAVARRVVSYPQVGEKVHQGDDLGFIKFGSRLDLLLPLDTKIDVSIGQRVTGNRTVVGRFPMG